VDDEPSRSTPLSPERDVEPIEAASRSSSTGEQAVRETVETARRAAVRKRTRRDRWAPAVGTAGGVVAEGVSMRDMS
jgi:L-rhamnose isomerase